MYDVVTAALIRSTPELPGLDREALPDALSRAFSQIVSARISLREGAEGKADISATVEFARRLARTNEALVAISPERSNRAAAGFVGATAYQLAYQAIALSEDDRPQAYLTLEAVSPDVASMLLFLVAGASADASEVARAIGLPESDDLQRELVLHLVQLAQGEVGAMVDRSLPRQQEMVSGTGGERANAALYYRLLRGVRALAFVLQGRRIRDMVDPLAVFAQVKDLAAPGGGGALGDFTHDAIAVFPGPFQLASLLLAAGSALLESAVVRLTPPDGVPEVRWRRAMRGVAKKRPYLWSNHRYAVERGYLEHGTSSVIGFPTGAGKSTTAQLKIHSTLLAGRKAVFIAPTHALVDQTTRDLRKAFPAVSVRGQRADELDEAVLADELSDIMVMTPEACLLLSHAEPDRFEEVGLLIFDECHLMHPKTDGDRRAIDAMLCIIGFARVAPQADIVLLSAMMKNTEELSGWLGDLTGRAAIHLDNAWKPTRQLRGCVVYDGKRIEKLYAQLQRERLKKPTGGVPIAVKRTLTAEPQGFFSLQQTWASMARKDYVLLPPIDNAVQFATNERWQLTPNSGALAAAIAAAAAEAGLRTLIFSQSIPNAVSIAGTTSAALDEVVVDLTEDEKKAHEVAVDEMGHPDLVYQRLNDGKLRVQAGTHHGLLLPEGNPPRG